MPIEDGDHPTECVDSLASTLDHVINLASRLATSSKLLSLILTLLGKSGLVPAQVVVMASTELTHLLGGHAFVKEGASHDLPVGDLDVLIDRLAGLADPARRGVGRTRNRSSARREKHHEEENE